MRDQLHLMELVDHYLDGTMNSNDRTAFEERLRNSEELRSLVEDQKRLRQAARRVPARAAAKKAYRNYRWGKSLPGMGAGAVVLIALLTVTFFAWPKGEREATSINEDTEATAISEGLFMHLGDTVGTGMVPLLMTIDPTRDTTMLTPNGVLVDVPKGTFADSTGQQVTTAVRLTMLEAFDAATIMKAGLSTMSGDILLETGGMFYIDAQSKGNKLSIADGRSVNVLVPADGVAPGMKLYDGVLQPEGDIDWQDPVELPRTLVPVDITTLDFYPPGYEAKLAELGQDVKNKAFEDSLYYSMRCSEQGREMMYEADSARFDSVQRSSKTLITVGRSGECGIDPARIKAIWNARFNGTNLATREFEERMRAIHGSCDNVVLDLYVNNLNEDLRTLDRQAARLGHGAFVAFAKRNDGRVELPAGSAERLKSVYLEWSRSFANAIHNAQNAYWQRQGELDAHMQQRAGTDRETESTAREQLLREETEMNLRSVYGQLGYAVVPGSGSINASSTTRQGAAQASAAQRPVALPRPPRIAFNARVRTLGWKNIDQAMSAAYARQSTTASDGRGGRQASITYDPCIISVTDQRSYDEVRVYLLPQGTAGYQRMNKGVGDRFEEKLNALLTYDLVVLAEKNGSSFFFEQRDLKGPTQHSASLQAISESDLLGKLNRYDPVRGTGLLNASNYMASAAADAPRQRRNKGLVELRSALWPVVYPCAREGVTAKPEPRVDRAVVSEVNEMYGILPEFDTAPTFPGGDRAMRQFIYTKLKIPEAAQQKGISGNVMMTFLITETGTVQDVRAVSGPDDGCWSEAERVVGQMPNWSPALKNGKPVAARMTLPVMFLSRMDRLK